MKLINEIVTFARQNTKIQCGFFTDGINAGLPIGYTDLTSPPSFGFLYTFCLLFDYQCQIYIDIIDLHWPNQMVFSSDP